MDFFSSKYQIYDFQSQRFLLNRESTINTLDFRSFRYMLNISISFIYLFFFSFSFLVHFFSFFLFFKIWKADTGVKKKKENRKKENNLPNFSLSA